MYRFETLDMLDQWQFVERIQPGYRIVDTGTRIGFLRLARYGGSVTVLTHTSTLTDRAHTGSSDVPTSLGRGSASSTQPQVFECFLGPLIGRTYGVYTCLPSGSTHRPQQVQRGCLPRARNDQVRALTRD